MSIPKNKLPLSFFTRQDVVKISQELLGKFLVTAIDGQVTAGKIVETEAYRAPEDKASHAWNNRRTPRTEIMFARGGFTYVYLCYGIHHLFNVVTGAENMPHAVLIRAIEPTDNIAVILQRRGFDKLKPQLSAGPGVMSSALGITTRHNALSLVDSPQTIWIEDRGIDIEPAQIQSGPRVGVAYAGECADWPWRFWIKDSPWVSKWKK